VFYSDLDYLTALVVFFRLLDYEIQKQAIQNRPKTLRKAKLA
jgi:hypothetical protein